MMGGVCIACLVFFGFWARGRFFVFNSLSQRFLTILFALASVSLIAISLGIIGLLLYQSVHFFQKVSIFDFLLGLKWDPSSHIESGQEVSQGFGVLPLLTGTFLITFIGLLTAIPSSLAIAIYLSFFGSKKKRQVLKSVMEVLAGVPSIVYGFFALYLISPLMHTLFSKIGWVITSESALTAGLVLGLMVVPYMASLADDALRAIPQALKDQALALGSTPIEMILHVCFPAAFPGLLGAIVLGFSRAVGETMLVVMAAGLTANLSFNPLHSVTTMTVQIVSLMTGDQEFESAKTVSAFALGLLLFLLTLLLNSVTIRVTRWHQGKYGTQ